MPTDLTPGRLPARMGGRADPAAAPELRSGPGPDGTAFDGGPQEFGGPSGTRRHLRLLPAAGRRDPGPPGVPAPSGTTAAHRAHGDSRNRRTGTRSAL